VPSLEGAVQVTVNDWLPGTTLEIVGVPGATLGVPNCVVEGSLSPIELVATTVTAYEVPLVKELMVQVSDPVVQPHVAEVAPAVAVTVYSVMVSPPSDVGSLQLTVN
jgi:hypothetical protein